MDSDITRIQKEVEKVLGDDISGHGMEHVGCVLRLSQKFAEQEKASPEEVALIALLHDVDDRKLFGDKQAEDLVNARRIMDNVGIGVATQEKVIRAIGEIGFGKRLNGTIPTTLEAKIVSDADMCDTLGARSILRAYSYGVKTGRPFFDKDVFPIKNITGEQYLVNNGATGVCHFFEKILRLKSLMLTESGRKEAKKRHDFVVSFLYNFFEENDAPEWIEYLKEYLADNDI